MHSSFIDDSRTVREQLFHSISSCDSLVHIKEVHGRIIRFRLHNCSYLISKLLRTLAKLNIFARPYAQAIFDRVISPNRFLHNALIRGYLTESSLDSAIDTYTRLRLRAIPPLSFTLSSLFKACGERTDLILGTQLHSQNIFIGGFSSDVVVNNAMIYMYVKCNQIESARRVFDEIPTRDIASWTTLIVAYTKSGAMDIAKSLFDELPERDIIAWTAMVTGYAQNGNPNEAIKHFLTMREADIKPDKIAFLGFISSCAQIGSSKYSDLIERAAKEYPGDLFIGTAIVDMYSKSGNIERAREVFNEMKSKNVYTYSSMIMGLAVHGKADEALNLFDEMLERKLKPNEVTVVAVLAACRHAGWWRVGLEIFRRYATAPSPEMYVTLVDMVGRAGFLREAREIAGMVPASHASGAWGALLTACRWHGDVETGEIAAQRVLEFEEGVSGNYLVLSGTYIGAGRWDHAANVTRHMNAKNFVKDRGFSRIITDVGGVHVFQASGTCHGRFWDVFNVIESLTRSSYDPMFWYYDSS